MIKKARSLNEERAAGVVYFNFSKAFNTVSCGILLSKLGCYGTDGRAIRWAKTWLDHQAARVMVNVCTLPEGQLQAEFLKSLFRALSCLITLSLTCKRG